MERNKSDTKSDEKAEVSREKVEKPNLKGDYGNLCLLFLLYVLQGDEFKLIL
jgi:hypothetical protein